MSTAVPFHAALALWARIGLISVGGPAAQIALLHRTLVREHRWIGEREFERALGFCTLLPGPEAQQLATYCGWRLHGVRGGLAAGVMFVLPGLLVIMLLAAAALMFGDTRWLKGAIFGLTGVTLALILMAFVHVARRLLTGTLATVLAFVTFIAMWGQIAPFPLLVIVGAALGAYSSRGQAESQPETIAMIPNTTASSRRTLTTAVKWLAIWLLPVILLTLLLGPANVLVELGWFFSQAAAFTFGGAYAILGYVSMQSVTTYQWLTAEQLAQGLALAETTPGPLLLVLSYVGFIGAYNEPGALAPLLAGVTGALVVAWCTFAPSFLWIFAGAPWIEHLTRNTTLARSVAAVSAVALGAMLKLALWFVLHALFSEQRTLELAQFWWPLPVLTSLKTPMLLAALLSSALLASQRVPTSAVILGAALSGAIFFVASSAG